MCGPEALRDYGHLQGGRYDRLGQEQAGIKKGLACGEMSRERCVCHRAWLLLLLLQKPARRQQADHPAQLAHRDPCQVGQVSCRHAHLEGNACENLGLCKPLETREGLDL